MSEQIEVAEIAEETFLGDLVSFVLDEIKHASKPWALLNEDEQDSVIERLEARSKTIVNRAINILASQNRANVVAKIESITFKAGIKAVVQLHTIVWSAVNGDIPESHCVVFIDGDKTNIRLSNLELITRSEHLQINKLLGKYTLPEARECLRTMGKISAKTYQLKKEKAA